MALVPGMTGLTARSSDPNLGPWTDYTRLNPSKGAARPLDDPRVAAAFTVLGNHIGPALANLRRQTEASLSAG